MGRKGDGPQGSAKRQHPGDTSGGAVDGLLGRVANPLMRRTDILRGRHQAGAGLRLIELLLACKMQGLSSGSDRASTNDAIPLSDRPA